MQGLRKKYEKNIRMFANNIYCWRIKHVYDRR